MSQLLQRGFLTVNKSDDIQLRIMQYNTLANSLSVNSGFEIEKTHPEILSWDYRCPRIIEEILQYAPSVVGLEEVDEAKYPDLEEGLRENYIGFFCKKRKSDNFDGCAVFYNKKM